LWRCALVHVDLRAICRRLYDLDVVLGFELRDGAVWRYRSGPAVDPDDLGRRRIESVLTVKLGDVGWIEPPELAEPDVLAGSIATAAA